MFGIQKTKEDKRPEKMGAVTSGRMPRVRQEAVEKEVIANLPVGRTGASRIEEELLCPVVSDAEVESWRVFKIIAELVTGFDLLRNYDLAATIFGSSRCEAGNAVYKDAELLGQKLVGAGFAVITGGANGVMQAANKGAKDAGGESVGLNIKLPTAQRTNGYTTDGHEFHYFFTRKVMLAFASEVYIFFPGGFGTLDEFFEILTLVQTKKVKTVPIILIGKEYWQPLVKWFETSLNDRYHTIDGEDMRIYDLVDSVDEVMEVIKKKVQL